MNIHINSELRRQHEAAKEVRSRLTAQAVSLQQHERAKAKITNLETMFRRATQDNVKLKDRIRLLDEQLFDAQTRIIELERRNYVLSEIKEVPTSERRSIKVICDEILHDYAGVTWADIISERRTKEILVPRHLCWTSVCAERSDLSIAHIARVFRRDHSTLLHVMKKHGISRRDAE